MLQRPKDDSLPYTEARFTAQDGLSLYYRDYPCTGVQDTSHADTRPVVLCLGGLTRNSKDFDGLARWLSDRYRVICPDYRGRGRSDYDPDPSHYRPETYLDDLRHLICVLRLHRVFIVGTSLGGLLSMGLAVAMPSVVCGAVLNDIGPDIRMPALDGVISFLREDRRYADLEDGIAELQKTFPHLPGYCDDDWREIAEATFVPDGTGKLKRDWDPEIVKPLLHGALPTFDLWPLFRNLARNPIAVVHGELSEFLTPETIEKMKAAGSDVMAVTLPNVGHAPSLKEPAARVLIETVLSKV